MNVGASMWEGGFHAISAFNNAGFGLASTNLVPYVGDTFIILPIALGIIGGLGFPVLLEMRQRLRHHSRLRMSLTMRFTLWGTGILLFLGTLGTAIFE